MYTVRQLESAIWRIEQVRVIIRLPVTTMVPMYQHKQKFDIAGTVKDLLVNRILLLLPKDTEVAVMGGGGGLVSHKTKLSIIRSSYKSKLSLVE